MKIILALSFLAIMSCQTNVDTKQSNALNPINDNRNETTLGNYSKKLNGLWTSLEDHKSQMRFTGNQLINFYEKKPIDTLNFNLEINKKGEIDVLVFDSSDTMRYSIANLSDTTLSWIYTENGNILSFKKIGSVSR